MHQRRADLLIAAVDEGVGIERQLVTPELGTATSIVVPAVVMSFWIWRSGLISLQILLLIGEFHPLLGKFSKKLADLGVLCLRGH